MTYNILVVGTAPRLKKPALRAARGGNWYRGPLGPYFFRLWLDLFRRNDKFFPRGCSAPPPTKVRGLALVLNDSKNSIESDPPN
jgi:hypothetical protein